MARDPVPRRFTQDLDPACGLAAAPDPRRLVSGNPLD